MAEEQIEETEQQGPSAEERAVAAERKVAFAEAGIDYKDGLGALLFDSYKGELTADAVKEVGKRYGVIAEPAPEPEQEISPEEQQSTTMRRAASTGAAVDDQSVHPVESARKAFTEARSTQTRDAAMVAGLQVLATAAKNGDRRVRLE